MSRILFDAASVLRSKNSGPFSLTFDILFEDEQTYKMIKEKGIINKKRVSELYSTPEDLISDIIYFDSALGIKFTISRKISSGSPMDTDVYGAQFHAPLMGIVID